MATQSLPPSLNTPAYRPAPAIQSAPLSAAGNSVFNQFALQQDAPAQPAATHKGKQGPRTKGMWLFDSLLYPVLTNVAVFAISVLATYATTFGKPQNFMRRRGDWAREQLKRIFKMSDRSAKETIMITFSFLDGCIMAPVVKMFEDRRNQIVKVFDRWLGTTPADQSVYDQEPKQSWASVLGGRTTAFLLVLPTAKLLSKKIRGSESLNEILFARPGKKIGEWIAKTVPSLTRRFPKLNIPGLAEVCAMEAFYTTLCTAGLYLSSRFLANKFNGKQTSS